MPISRIEFFEFQDDNWKNRVFNFLRDYGDSETPAFGVLEIAQNLSTFDSKLPDTKRMVEWALEDLVTEGKVMKTGVRLNNNYYYMVKEL
jgi:hypothetical protein